MSALDAGAAAGWTGHARRDRFHHSGRLRDQRTGFAMTGLLSRKIIPGLCTLSAATYLITRDNKVRARA